MQNSSSITRPHWIVLGLGWGYTMLVVMLLLNISLFKTEVTNAFILKNIASWTVAGLLWGFFVRYLTLRKEKQEQNPA